MAQQDHAVCTGTRLRLLYLKGRSFLAIMGEEGPKLYVGGLKYETTEETLKDAFAKFGKIIEAVIIYDRATNRSRGFGFVTFEDTETAKIALEQMHDTELEGRKLLVNYAKKRDGAGRGGGYGGGGYSGGGFNDYSRQGYNQPGGGYGRGGYGGSYGGASYGNDYMYGGSNYGGGAAYGGSYGGNQSYGSGSYTGGGGHY